MPAGVRSRIDADWGARQMRMYRAVYEDIPYSLCHHCFLFLEQIMDIGFEAVDETSALECDCCKRQFPPVGIDPLFRVDGGAHKR